MSFGEILQAIQDFVANTGTYAIALMIALDVILGVAAAIKNGVFKWAKVWQFYRTMIIPYLITYLVLQIAVAFAGDIPTLPEALTVILSGLPGVAFATITGALVTSIIAHVKSIGLPIGTE